MSTLPDAYLEGYQQALRDAVAAIGLIERSLVEGKNYGRLAIILPALAVAQDAITSLEPGILSPATGHQKR